MTYVYKEMTFWFISDRLTLHSHLFLTRVIVTGRARAHGTSRFPWRGWTEGEFFFLLPWNPWIVAHHWHQLWSSLPEPQAEVAGCCQIGGGSGLGVWPFATLLVGRNQSSFLPQGEDGEIGPRGLPGESVSWRAVNVDSLYICQWHDGDIVHWLDRCLAPDRVLEVCLDLVVLQDLLDLPYVTRTSPRLSFKFLDIFLTVLN